MTLYDTGKTLASGERPTTRPDIAEGAGTLHQTRYHFRVGRLNGSNLTCSPREMRREYFAVVRGLVLQDRATTIALYGERAHWCRVGPLTVSASHPVPDHLARGCGWNVVVDHDCGGLRSGRWCGLRRHKGLSGAQRWVKRPKEPLLVPQLSFGGSEFLGGRGGSSY